ncbi:hypothetical protein ACMYSQ_005751 [Aspergillus niger]
MSVYLTAQKSIPNTRLDGPFTIETVGFLVDTIIETHTIQARLHSMKLTITCHVNWYQLSGPTVSSQQTWENLSNECPGKAKTRRKRKPSYPPANEFDRAN